MHADLPTRVKRCIERHAMFSPGERVAVGCSGGADSSCLLHVLAEGLREWSLSLVAVYVDHGLRDDTRAEREWVRRLAGRCGAEYVEMKVDVPARVAATGESVQEAARELRYEALRRAAAAQGARRIAVGHTLTDQAETVLMQALRGAGLRGLSGIAPVLGDIVRPLLWVSRAETESYCREHGLEYVDDPSNASDTYLRNRIRRRLFPLLAGINPAAERHLAQLAEIAREEDAVVAAEAERAARALFEVQEAEGAVAVRVDGKALTGLSRAIARRLVRRAYGMAAGDEKGLDFDHVEEVLERAPESRGSFTIGVFGGVAVRNEYGRVVFEPSGANRAEPQPERPVNVPGETVHAGLAVRLRAQVVDGPLSAVRVRFPPGPRRALLDWEKLAPPLAVRSRKEGDRLQPLGLSGTKKVKDILIDAKVPKSQREKVPVVADRRGVVWVVGYALAERVRAGEESRRILCLEAEPL